MAAKRRAARSRYPGGFRRLAGSTLRIPGMINGDGAAWLILGAAVLVLVLCTPALERAATPLSLDDSEVRFQSAPAWVGESLIAHLGRLAARQTDAASIRRADLVAIQDTLERSGWFETVHQVSRDASGSIEIDATFLSPAAVIEDTHGQVVVDASGRPLPSGCRLSQQQHVITIINPRASRPTRARQPWRGDDVAAALRLVPILEHRPWTGQIRSIDLSRFDRDGTLSLITDEDTTMIWGSAPGEETPLEALADRKIHRLDESHRTHGRVDQHLPGPLDLTDASHIVSR